MINAVTDILPPYIQIIIAVQLIIFISWINFSSFNHINKKVKNYLYGFTISLIVFYSGFISLQSFHHPFYKAIKNDDQKQVKTLLEKNDRLIKRYSFWGGTPLQSAVELEHEKIVHLLIKKGADVNDTGLIPRTPLYIASLKKNFSISEFLVS